jgi:predicted exporter
MDGWLVTQDEAGNYWYLPVLRQGELRAAHQHQRIVLQLFTADAGEGGVELGSQLALAQNGQKLRLMDGWLVTQDEAGNYWYLLHYR